MGADEHKCMAPKSVNFAVITVSDTRTEKDDSSGNAIIELLGKEGHRLLRRIVVKDEVQEIQKALRELVKDAEVQAVIMNGGTGLAERDVSIEAVSHFMEKEIPGFGELFRMLSYQEIGSPAMMSRATGFVTDGKVVFCLPGSEKAVRLAVSKLICPELGHIVWELRR